jgi:hypothetical protein
LRPLTDQVKALDASLQNTPKTGGSALQPTGPGTSPTPEAGLLAAKDDETMGGASAPKPVSTESFRAPGRKA